MGDIKSLLKQYYFLQDSVILNMVYDWGAGKDYNRNLTLLIECIKENCNNKVRLIIELKNVLDFVFIEEEYSSNDVSSGTALDKTKDGNYVIDFIALQKSNQFFVDEDSHFKVCCENIYMHEVDLSYGNTIV